MGVRRPAPAPLRRRRRRVFCPGAHRLLSCAGHPTDPPPTSLPGHPTDLPVSQALRGASHARHSVCPNVARCHSRARRCATRPLAGVGRVDHIRHRHGLSVPERAGDNLHVSHRCGQRYADYLHNSVRSRPCVARLRPSWRSVFGPQSCRNMVAHSRSCARCVAAFLSCAVGGPFGLGHAAFAVFAVTRLSCRVVTQHGHGCVNLPYSKLVRHQTGATWYSTKSGTRRSDTRPSPQHPCLPPNARLRSPAGLDVGSAAWHVLRHGGHPYSDGHSDMHGPPTQAHRLAEDIWSERNR